jgi:Protein of unknown function (DUF3489)
MTKANPRKTHAKTTSKTQREAAPQSARTKKSSLTTGPGCEPVDAVSTIPPLITLRTQLEQALRTGTGASLAELCTMSGWQAHSCRAFLSGLRKRGDTLLRTEDVDGVRRYRLKAPLASKESMSQKKAPPLKIKRPSKTARTGLNRKAVG